ncbi:MAG: hypothetical protein WC663_00195 [Patescibacteria group bacterium]|jgi:hypothetical protein
MRNDKHSAILLRKKGASYNEISNKLGIPKSTMHYWFKNCSWSNVIKKSLINKAKIDSIENLKTIRKRQGALRLTKIKKCRVEAINQFHVLKNNLLFVAGLMLYWGEGDRVLKYPLRLSNTDAEMIKLFYNFLIKICNVDLGKIRISLVLYPDLDDFECKKYWCSKTGISIKNFDKSSTIYGKHPTARLMNGICLIRVNDSHFLKEKVLVWIKLMSKEINNMRV